MISKWSNYTLFKLTFSIFSTLVNVVQHGYVPVNLKDILKFSLQDDGNACPRVGIKIKYQAQLSTLRVAQDRIV